MTVGAGTISRESGLKNCTSAVDLARDPCPELLMRLCYVSLESRRVHNPSCTQAAVLP